MCPKCCIAGILRCSNVPILQVVGFSITFSAINDPQDTVTEPFSQAVAVAGSYTQCLKPSLIAEGSWKCSFRTAAAHFFSLEGLETPSKTGRVSIGASLGNSSCLISFSVGKAKQVQQKGKVTYTAVKSLIVTGSRSQVIILIGGF